MPKKSAKHNSSICIYLKIEELIKKSTPKGIVNLEYGKVYRKRKHKIRGINRYINHNLKIKIEYIYYVDDFITSKKGMLQSLIY